MNDYDPLSSEVKQDPQRYFRELRASCPVHHHRLHDVDVDRMNANPLVARPTAEFWSVFRYGDCAGILQDPEHFSSREGPGPERLQPLNEDGMLLWADDPAHRHQRRIANKAFTPRMVEQMRPRIQQVVDELLSGLAGRGRAELMSDFAVPLAITVIAEILGVGRERVSDFRRWGNATVAAFGGDQDAIEHSVVAMTELFGFLGELIVARRAIAADGGEPPDDVLTSLIMSDYEGSRFTDDEILMASHQLLTAGFETTSTAIGNAVYLLCTNPSERDKLARDADLVDTLVEEVLRYEAPIEGLFRTTTDAVSVDGTDLPLGAKVRVVFASANRDGSQFEDPDTFRADRDPTEVRRHLAFGFGPHACIGAPLARAELRAAVTSLFGRLPGLALDPEHRPERNDALIINGFRTLPVRWDPVGSPPA